MICMYWVQGTFLQFADFMCRQDISAQLVLKWDRMGDVEIECIKDMSSLTFDVSEIIETARSDS